MEKAQYPRRILAMLGVFAAVMALYLAWARPFQLRWGATDDEVQRAMPGDQLSARPSFLATRAITIEGTPAQIWPWLIQMGYTRAGLYGFDLFQSVGTPRGAQEISRILPQFQDFKVGDEVRVTPVTTMVFDSIEPYDHIVWSTKGAGSSITWALSAVDDSQTRLVSRTRWSHRWDQPGWIGLDLMNEFTDHLTMRKILQGVKGRVEGNIESRLDLNIEFFIYLGALIVFLWAATSVLRLPLTWGSWLVAFVAGITWLITWYAPTSIWIGAALSLLIVWAVRVEFRELRRLKKAQIERAKPRAQEK